MFLLHYIQKRRKEKENKKELDKMEQDCIKLLKKWRRVLKKHRKNKKKKRV